MRPLLAILALPLAGIGTTASAQVCTEASPGVARIDTAGVTVTIHLAGFVPSVNGVSCGFTASAIDVVGVAGNDTVILNFVPPSVPVTVGLGAGANDVRVYTTNGDDTVTCLTGQVDRDDDGQVDLDLMGSTLATVAFYTRGGNDRVNCGSFDYKMTINGGNGDDTLSGGPFDDTVIGGNDNDTLFGNGGNDRLDGGLGSDTVRGNDGDDIFVAKPTFDGIDHFFGGAGNDKLTYNARTTPVLASLAGPGGTSEDEIAEDIETIRGGKSNDTLDFSTAVLPHTLWGGPGNDALLGGAGADRLYGEAGGDYIAGGGARDPVLDGGDGGDSMGFALDGFVETVRCGAGTDAYLGNLEDTFVACETTGGTATSDRIAVGVAHSCALTTVAAVRCWGYGGDGQLGNGATSHVGDDPGEMGSSTPAVDLGSPHVPVAISAGWVHNCALLDDGTVKCWGFNEQGQLGLGDTQTRGNQPGEMGNLLPTVDLGPGRTAVAISAGGLQTCAILDNGSLKCWGWNYIGQLGLGDTENRGDEPGEMGAALPAVDLGAGRTAVAIEAGYEHTCALLDDGSVKCWGRGDLGSLGQGDTTTRGDAPGEMGGALPPIALGVGRTAIRISVGRLSTCAILDDRTVKCWGYGGDGQLGYGDTENRGDQPGEMGDALPLVPLGRMAISVSAGLFRNCAVLDDGTAKCWGWNELGGLGQGDLESRGDDPGELAVMPAIALGTGVTVVALAAGDGYHTCAKLDNATLKCWGHNGTGELGYEDALDRGDEPGEMGDVLPAVDMGGIVALAPAPSRADHAAAPEVALGVEDDDVAEDLDDPTDDGVDAEADEADAGASGCSSSRSGGGGWLAAVVLALALARREVRRVVALA